MQSGFMLIDIWGYFVFCVVILEVGVYYFENVMNGCLIEYECFVF